MIGHELLVQHGEIHLCEPDPKAVCDIDPTARMLSRSRRMIVLCCEYGLISTLMDPGRGGWYFDSRSIRRLRKTEALCALCAGNLPVVQMILKLQAEVDRPDAESRFLGQPAAHLRGVNL